MPDETSLGHAGCFHNFEHGLVLPLRQHRLDFEIHHAAYPRIGAEAPPAIGSAVRITRSINEVASMVDDWKEMLKSVVAEDTRKGDVLIPHTYVLGALIVALHSKGVLSDEDRNVLFEAFDNAGEAGFVESKLRLEKSAAELWSQGHDALADALTKLLAHPQSDDPSTDPLGQDQDREKPE